MNNMLGKKIRIDRFLTHVGYGTRTEVHRLIKQKRVMLNQQIVSKADLSVVLGENSVYVDHQLVVYQEFYYYIMNKPQGVITATQDAKHQTVIDLLEPIDQRKSLVPVGRLDKDTEGLLILTNNGKFAHELLSPKKHIDKVYYAQVSGMITLEDVKQFAAGITLKDGTIYQPAQLEIIRSSDVSEVYITLTEGKFHQVKRMVMAVGKEVTYLKRIKMGGLCLPEDLKKGCYRALTEEELQSIKQT